MSTRGSYRAYGPEDLTNAYIAVKDRKMSLRKAAAIYGIPKTTLIDRINGKVSIDVVKSGPQPIFSLEQETFLTHHLKMMSEIGYGYGRQKTINLASDYSVSLGLRDKDHPLTDQWFYSFLARWPELKVVKPRALDVTRAKSATRSAIENYFKELHNILTKYHPLDKPQMIYNIDEKGLSIDHKPPKIVSGKHNKTQAITSGKSQTVTLIGCVNGIGQQVPPFFVFPGARMLDSLMQDATPGADGTVSPTGWSNTDVFNDYMKNHLTKYLLPRTEEKPALVLYDGHRSHISLGLIKWAKSNNIVLFVLPPHCSHLLQPLDISCFGPFEVAWNSACQHHIRESGLITRYDICHLACKIYAATLSVSNIQSAFRKCGLYPYNPEVISDIQLAPSTTFKRHESTPSQESNPVSVKSVSAEEFLQGKRDKILQNFESSGKPRDTLSKVVGGKAITEDDILEKIVEHTERHCPKENQTPGKKRKINQTKKMSPIPSTSGISKKKPKKVQFVPFAETDSDESDADDEKCIVCNQFSPDINKKPFLLLVSWGQCDNCSKWVHLSFCSPVRVIRRGDSFLCPRCGGPTK